MQFIRVPAFAKVNLRLDVLGRRADGYHELRTIFQSLTLHDTLYLDAHAEARDRTARRGQCGAGRDPGARKSGVARVADALRRELKLAAGFASSCEKRIPVGRGLGGGSSDAAAALVGLAAPDAEGESRRSGCWKSPRV